MLANNLLFFVIVQYLQLCIGCPHKCLCFKSIVRCSFQHLKHVPSLIPNDTTVLDLRFNKIGSIGENDFVGLEQLQVLFLNDNRLKTIQPGSFKPLTRLRSLYLHSNNLNSVTSETFNGLYRLQFLYLQQNKLSGIPDDAFEHNRFLKRLYLSHNRLATIPRSIFESLPYLERLLIDANTLNCDCNLLWLAEKLNTTLEFGSKNTLCANPLDIKGKRVAELRQEELHCKLPQITMHPQSTVAVRFGETVRFECRVDGEPRPDIIWLHNETAINMNDKDSKEIGRHFVFTDGTLKISPTAPEDQGYYECLAKNVLGSTRTRRAYLVYADGDAAADQPRISLAGFPELSRRPSSEIVDEGGRLKLSCEATGNPVPVLEWTVNSRRLDDSVQVYQSVLHGSVVSSSMEVLATKRRHAGIYRCSARNAHGAVYSDARVNVRYAPQLTLRPSDVRVAEGSEVKLHCEAEGYPTPNITWHKDGHSARETVRLSITPGGTVLRIYPTLQDDAGVYTCRVQNSIGKTHISARVRLTKNLTPKIVEAPSNINAQVGSSVSLQCRAEGYPQPSINWLFNGSPIPTVQGHFEITARGTLFVHGITLQDAGHYTCQAVNDVGAQSAEAVLAVQDNHAKSLVDADLIRSSVNEARSNVDRAINSTKDQLYDGKPKSPAELMALFRYPGPQAVELARAREIYDETLNIIERHVERGLMFNLSTFSYKDILSQAHLNLIAELSGCHIHRLSKLCEDMCYHLKYRSYDGTCNNFQHPTWGASLTPFKRALKPIYENGFNQPVGWNRGRLYYGHEKPNARLISIKVIRSRTENVPVDDKHSHMLMQWGQFIDHDLDFGPAAPSTAEFQSGRNCKHTCEFRPPCFNIEIPHDDERVRRVRCLEFERTSSVCGSGETSVFMNTVQPREQINTITSYIDGSNVYGSNQEDADKLRDFVADHGFLAFDTVSDKHKPYLLYNRDTPMDCRRNSSIAHTTKCFLAGDYRANEQLGLLTMHTVWHRQHNRLAAELLAINPNWDGERIYQEVRRIVGAQLQHITYADWLPKVLGPVGMQMLGSYDGYHTEVDASVSNVFATAGLRFGHTLINPVLFRLNASMQPIPEGNLMLHEAFFAPDKLTSEGGTDPILRGLFGAPSKKLTPQSILNLELTERLFSQAEQISLDLAALNIQRGRDHALPGYLEWRRFCNLSTPNSWEEMTDIPDRELLRNLRELYGHPGNIDVWVGGVCEKVLPEAKVGPLLACLLVDTFKRVRDGDRFWFEAPGVFKPEQVAEIKRSSLAKVMCSNSDDIQRIPADVFLYEGQNVSTYKLCSELHDLNLHLWQECCSECQNFVTYNVNKEPAEISRRHRRNVTPLQTQVEGLQSSVAELQRTIEQLSFKLAKLEERRNITSVCT